MLCSKARNVVPRRLLPYVQIYHPVTELIKIQRAPDYDWFKLLRVLAFLFSPETIIMKFSLFYPVVTVSSVSIPIHPIPIHAVARVPFA